MVPWRKPWSSAGLPRNLVSEKPYRGINCFLLSASTFVSPFWLTIRQANQLGGHVRKGEESTVVIFWRIENVEAKSEESNRKESNEKQQRHFLFRYYHLFNLEQCVLPKAVIDKLPGIERHEHAPISACSEIMGCMPKPPEIQHAGSKAFYNVQTDRVTLPPPPELFVSAEEYYATGFHELIHSTGHEKRLGRESIVEAAPFGSPVYSFEEMVAEMGAAYLCAEAGISPAVLDNQGAYISGWLARLRDDRRFVIRATVQAQHAADYLLGRVPTTV